MARVLPADVQNALAVRAAAGDDGARAEAVASVAGLVRLVVNRTARSDRDDAEQDALAAVLRAVPRFDPARGTFRTFAAAVARYAVLSRRRDDRRRLAAVRVGLPGADADDGDPAGRLPSREPDPGDADAADGREFWGRLAGLPDRERRAVSAWARGVPSPAIAADLGVSRARVYQLRDRGVRRLREGAGLRGRGVRARRPPRGNGAAPA